MSKDEDFKYDLQHYYNHSFRRNHFLYCNLKIAKKLLGNILHYHIFNKCKISSIFRLSSRREEFISFQDIYKSQNSILNIYPLFAPFFHQIFFDIYYIFAQVFPLTFLLLALVFRPYILYCFFFHAGILKNFIPGICFFLGLLFF